jgi:hypothetical protein
MGSWVSRRRRGVARAEIQEVIEKPKLEIIALIVAVAAVLLSLFSLSESREAKRDAKVNHTALEAGIIARIEGGLTKWAQAVQNDLNNAIPPFVQSQVAASVAAEMAKHSHGHLVIEGPTDQQQT